MATSKTRKFVTLYRARIMSDQIQFDTMRAYYDKRDKWWRDSNDYSVDSEFYPSKLDALTSLAGRLQSVVLATARNLAGCITRYDAANKALRELETKK